MDFKGVNYVIEDDRLFLRTLNESDASKDYVLWLNDEEVNKYLITRYATVEGLKEYIRQKNESSNCLFFGIFWKENNKHIGNIKLEPIDFELKNAVMGILIGDKNYWGMGIGTDATNLITDYAFKNLDINEIFLGVLSENKPAVRVYEKCGFEIFKIDKKDKEIEGKYYDQVWMRKIKKV
jgi:RimJ/RimL family protein N-acetyltransferase